MNGVKNKKKNRRKKINKTYQAHKYFILQTYHFLNEACKAFTHTYRANFSCFSWSKSCWCCCSCDFAHRLQSFASNWHFLLVVVIIAFLLTHKQFIWVTWKVWWTFGYLFRLHGRLGCGSCRRRVSFDFGLSSCRGFFSFLTAIAGSSMDLLWKRRLNCFLVRICRWGGKNRKEIYRLISVMDKTQFLDYALIFFFCTFRSLPDIQYV